MFAGWATASWAADAASIPNLGGGAKLQKTEAARRAEDEKCTHCHDETETRPILAIYQTKHGVRGDARTPTCQDCHGPSEKHLGGNIDGTGRPRPDRIFGTHRTPAGYEPSSPQEQTEVCLSCHKAGLRMRWPGSQHQSNDVPCAACHTNHTPQDKVLVKTEQPAVCFACHKEQRAQIKQISTHPIDAGKISCSDCHNPHGSSGPKLLAKNTITETCFTCHADKRGPFLWEHQPVNEDCTNCHTPHGSNITPLLKSRPPFLCIECHNGPHQSSGSTAIGSNTALASGTTYGARGCMNCHTMVHGSNSPAGAFLHR
ncbi:MAG: DmsE family decaheme c-type cytochrome [Betaproteobacteria bacterium]|nr:DmsE family decaheme c-type cytochrome [Betaproteobacteria bacterium]